MTPTIPVPTPSASPTCDDSGARSSMPGFWVSANYFNPVQGILGFVWQVPDSDSEGVRIFDSAGEFVRHLPPVICATGVLSSAEWDGRNYAGSLVASGIYIVVLRHGTPVHDWTPVVRKVAVVLAK